MKAMDDRDIASGLRKRGSIICRKVYRNFTVPSDDANFDPPKFAQWGNRNELFSVYGASCFLFIPVGIWLIFLTSACADACYNGSLKYIFATPVEGMLYIVVGVTSLHGDVLYMGRESYWHVADRMLAQSLICLNVLHVCYLTATHLQLGIAACACCILPTLSYYRSYMARDFEYYKACHSMWHVTAALNKAMIGYLAILMPTYKSSSVDGWQVHVVVALILAAELVFCIHVWSLKRRWATTADTTKLVEQ